MGLDRRQDSKGKNSTLSLNKGLIRVNPGAVSILSEVPAGVGRLWEGSQRWLGKTS